MDREDGVFIPRSRSSISGTPLLRLFHFALQFLTYYLDFQVLEYMGGGDLLNLLIERDTFDEDFTRFYMAEVTAAS
jgi:serine/threonine protein kinase